MNSELLRHLRIQRGLTQEELSHRSGVSVRTIRNVECGLIDRPRRKSVELLLAVLDPDHRHLRMATTDDMRLGTEAWRGPRQPHTSLVGRDGDVRDLGNLVLANQIVLVTGPGGVGKSRVALAAAESVGPRFPGGVAVVEMGRVPREQDLHGETAVELALDAVRDLFTGDDGADELGRLLVLDNTEHLSSTVPVLVDRLLDDQPTLHCLITSRRAPVLYGARLLELGPLSGEAAVELLTDRVRTSCPALDLSDELPRIAELARQLDRLPRLLEFAAYRLRTAPLSTLLSRQYGMRLLGSVDSATLPHQRTVRDSLRWSLDLLDERHRELLTRLAQRRDGVSFDAGGAVEDEFASPEAMELLANLADSSLLQVDRGRSYEYRMLRHVKAFLAEAGRS